MGKVCNRYEREDGGVLNDGSPCKHCDAPASAHPEYNMEWPTIGAANSRQIGGDHYKTGGEEHWDRMWRLYGRGYFIGQVTKYVERAHKKNGIEDLEKAKHFLEKYIELQKAADSGQGPKPGGEYSEK